MTKLRLVLAAGALCYAAVVSAKGPVVAYFTGEPADVSAALANLCINRGIPVVEQDPNHVVCTGEVSGFKGALTQLLIGNAYSTTPEDTVRFSIVRGTGYSVVQATQWVETQMAFGQVRRVPIDGKKQNAQLLDAMISAGGFNVPPTVLAARAEATTQIVAAPTPPVAVPSPVPVTSPAAAPVPAASATPTAVSGQLTGHVQCVTCRR